VIGKAVRKTVSGLVKILFPNGEVTQEELGENGWPLPHGGFGIERYREAEDGRRHFRKESVQRGFSYVQAKKTELGIACDLETSDLHVEVIDLLGNRVEAEVGIAFFVASYSALRKAPVSPALLVLGDMSVQGNITSPVAYGAASGSEGQRCEARSHSYREQAELPRCERRHYEACRSRFLW